MNEEELKKRKKLVNSIIEPYQRKISLKTEVRLFLDGAIDEETMKKVISKNSEKNEELRVNRMYALVQGLKNYPDDISNLKAMFDYREMRIKQGYYLDLLAKDDDKENHKVNLSALEREKVEEELLKTEGKRKDGSTYYGDTRNKKHDRALANFHGLMRDINSLGLNFGYTIPFLESAKYDREKMDQNIRKEITDWMFQVFEDIEEIDMSKLREKMLNVEKEKNQNISEKDIDEDAMKMIELKKGLMRQSREFGGTIKQDDGEFLPG